MTKRENGKQPQEKQEVDAFRDTPLRYMGYANELGESFRSVVNVNWVTLSYLVASSYVLADTVSKSRKEWKATRSSGRTAAKAVDVLLWQSLASVMIPGLVINRICAGARYVMRQTPLAKNAKWYSVAVGLISIPLIIHPIDRAVDYGMDHTIRPLIGEQ